MVWLVVVLVTLALVSLSSRSPNFLRVITPALFVAAAFAMMATVVIWTQSAERRAEQFTQTAPAGGPVLTSADLQLTNLQFTQGKPATSYKVTGTIFNNSPSVALSSFQLRVTLQDCPSETCTVIGDDSTLVIARVPAGSSQTFESFLTIANPALVAPTTPKWVYDISDIKPYKP
ncbi:hypothetical protein IFT84_10100 [Rhizobium sp. CFBP 8762]|uniref:hypothetical protein n=1 Tax=Rhizobium sp. CFBP 8762 TaxID=2775279 RepID=UPI001786E2B3|nr:hypothetical protein [Rhizobium sp. CFBP 8762]MBD8554875.1 hypothetical protein [Rhizobium sp. CFBP 8762]